MPQAVDGEQDQSAPDDRKPDQTHPVERLTVDQRPDEELKRRADVLQQADRRESLPEHRDPKKDTYQGGEIIAQAALDHPAVGHAPDEAETLGADENRRSEMPRELTWALEHPADLPPSPPTTTRAARTSGSTR